MWAVMMLEAELRTWRKGLSSQDCNSDRDLEMVGKERWESMEVSPWPGKCLGEDATPKSVRPLEALKTCCEALSGSICSVRHY